MERVGIVIPVYKPDEKFDRLLEMLYLQQLMPSEICLMLTLTGKGSAEEEAAELRRRAERAEKRAAEKLSGEGRSLPVPPVLRILTVKKSEFDHGGTRQRGMEALTTELAVCMTMDAVPENDRLLLALYDALRRNPNASQSYARQLAGSDADLLCRLTQNYNYPAQEIVKDRSCYPKMGIKTVFCSDVCCMYRKEIFEKLGGFTRNVIFNEDMMFARKAVDNGYSVVYAAKAEVLHWHNYSFRQQFHRNFDNGVSQAEHPEFFKDIPAEGEGMRMVKKNALLLLRKGRLLTLVRYIFQCGAKFLGFRLGKSYRRLPKWLVLKCTMTPSHFV